jgi:hypothetical protein
MRCNKFFWLVIAIAILTSCEEGDQASFADSGGTGQGGSMTRFAINGNYMYVVDNNSIKVFSIGAGNFQELEDVEVDWGMETIFAKGDYLYLGANNAMYIYSIADAEHPTFIFRYQHIVACDPVVVQGNRAYVTMRSSGGNCNRTINQLDIIDITDPYTPKLLHSYPMTAPYGLGVSGNLLFLCEGEAGFNVYDITNEHNIQLTDQRSDFFAYDVIIRNGMATVTGEDGIFQLSYSGIGKLTVVSKIPVTRAEL